MNLIGCHEHSEQTNKQTNNYMHMVVSCKKSVEKYLYFY